MAMMCTPWQMPCISRIDSRRELDAALARDAGLAPPLPSRRACRRGTTTPGRLALSHGAALFRFERNDAGQDRDAIGFHGIDEALQRIAVIHGLRLQHLRAGVDLAPGVLDFGIEPVRARIAGGAENRSGVPVSALPA